MGLEVTMSAFLSQAKTVHGAVKLSNQCMDNQVLNQTHLRASYLKSYKKYIDLGDFHLSIQQFGHNHKCMSCLQFQGTRISMGIIFKSYQGRILRFRLVIRTKACQGNEHIYQFLASKLFFLFQFQTLLQQLIYPQHPFLKGNFSFKINLI